MAHWTLILKIKIKYKLVVSWKHLQKKTQYVAQKLHSNNCKLKYTNLWGYNWFQLSFRGIKNISKILSFRHHCITQLLFFWRQAASSWPTPPNMYCISNYQCLQRVSCFLSLFPKQTLKPTEIICNKYLFVARPDKNRYKDNSIIISNIFKTYNLLEQWNNSIECRKLG